MNVWRVGIFTLINEGRDVTPAYPATRLPVIYFTLVALCGFPTPPQLFGPQHQVPWGAVYQPPYREMPGRPAAALFG